jgi:DNA-binding NtrC family response regulator
MRATLAQAMSQANPNGVKTTKGRRPVIFLVDDEPVLLDLAEISLQGGDYSLKKFLDPELALDAFLNSRSKPDLLITDYALGKMNGLELIERCKEAKPDLKTILVSGTAGAEIVLESGVKVDRFVGKPYQPTGLAELVHRVLGEAA